MECTLPTIHPASVSLVSSVSGFRVINLFLSRMLNSYTVFFGLALLFPCPPRMFRMDRAILPSPEGLGVVHSVVPTPRYFLSLHYPFWLGNITAFMLLSPLSRFRLKGEFSGLPTGSPCATRKPSTSFAILPIGAG